MDVDNMHDLKTYLKDCNKESKFTKYKVIISELKI